MNEIFYTANLMGGLGNQTFQIAHAYAQSKRHNVNLYFKPNSTTKLQGFNTSKYIDNIFRKLNFRNDITINNVINSEWQYKPIVFNPKLSTEFKGYFQTSKNFKDYENEIINIFSPSEIFINKIKKISPSIFMNNNVIIHIRRGDYLKFQEIHPIIDISYITKCLSQVNNYDDIYIVTDDKEWVKNNLEFKFNLIDNLEDYEELWLMTLFPNVIMSNSTFSWWGSFLNKTPNKNVFVPSTWFGPNGEKHIEDLYEKDWIKINVKYENGKLVCY